MRSLVLLSLAAALAGCPTFVGDLCDTPGYCSASDAGGDAAKDSGTDGAPPGCPSGKQPKDDPTCVTDAFGVFVAPSGADTNAGTKMAPVASLTEAFKKAKAAGRPRVFVCEGTYTESAELKDSTSVYGGFKCGDWSYSGAKPKLTGAKADFVLRIDGVTGVSLSDLELVGADVPAATKGGSSVGVFVTASSGVMLSRLAIAGGTPQPGADGTRQDFSPFPDESTTLKGNDASGTSGGGPKPYAMCPGGGTTTGGKGGDNGMVGDPGLPALGGGQGGVLAACNMGGGGSDGAAASSAATGSGATAPGSLTPSGWTPAPGLKGTDGAPGQGGGGGLGFGNGGGGGGGAGGCGGAGGGGGGGGGGSMALVSLNSTVTLVACSLASTNGAKGGNGIAGQAGQAQGGNAGVFTGGGCAGGKGGAGGAGGAGGGGAGGISVGILYKGTKPTYAGDTSIAPGTKGAKGSGAGAGNDGVDGVSQAELLAP